MNTAWSELAPALCYTWEPEWMPKRLLPSLSAAMLSSWGPPLISCSTSSSMSVGISSWSPAHLSQMAKMTKTHKTSVCCGPFQQERSCAQAAVVEYDLSPSIWLLVGTFVTSGINQDLT